MQKFLCVFASLMLVASSANAWDLFGPKNYDQCVRQGLKATNTNLQVRALIATCSSEFSDKRKDTGEFDDDLRQCGVGKKLMDYWLPIEHSETRKTIKKLTNVKLSVKPRKYSTSFASLAFQNRTDFSISRIRVGFTNSDQCVDDYDLAVDFSGNPIKSGTFGTLGHIDNVAALKDHKGFCILTVQHESVDTFPVDKGALFGFLSTSGFCD